MYFFVDSATSCTRRQVHSRPKSSLMPRALGWRQIWFSNFSFDDERLIHPAHRFDFFVRPRLQNHAVGLECFYVRPFLSSPFRLPPPSISTRRRPKPAVRLDGSPASPAGRHLEKPLWKARGCIRPPSSVDALDDGAHRRAVILKLLRAKMHTPRLSTGR